MENNSYQFANAFRSFSVKAGAEHVYPLFDRSASLSFASEEYRNIGIGAIVSGGARGIDTVSETEALLNGSFVVEYLSGSLLKKLRKSDTVRQIHTGSLLLMSAARPDTGFHVGVAMR